MRNDINRIGFASFGGLPDEIAALCQRLLARREELVPHLCHNPGLTEDTWFTLWGATRPSADHGKALVSRKLTRAQRETVVRKESRTSVLEQFLEFNELDLDEQRLLAGKDNVAGLLLSQEWCHPTLRKSLALKAKGLHLLGEIAYGRGDLFSDSEVVSLLSTYHEWGSEGVRGAKRRERSAALRVLFGRRPGVIDSLLVPTTSIPDGHLITMLTAAAGSANITAEQARSIATIQHTRGLHADDLQFCWLALLANPRCPHAVAQELDDSTWAANRAGKWQIRNAAERCLQGRVVEGSLSELSDPEDLARIWQRAKSSAGQWGCRPVRPVEALELATNEHLDTATWKSLRLELLGGVPDQLVACYRDTIAKVHPGDEVRGMSREQRALVYEHSTPARLSEAFALAAERLGTDSVKWETLLGLLDDFDGTFEELVTLAETI